MSVNETFRGAIAERRSGEERASEARARKRSRREFAAAWLVGGAIWLAGLGVLALAQDVAAGGMAGTAAAASAAYYLPDNRYSKVQDITGRYPVVIRSLSWVVSR